MAQHTIMEDISREAHADESSDMQIFSYQQKDIVAEIVPLIDVDAPQHYFADENDYEDGFNDEDVCVE